MKRKACHREVKAERSVERSRGPTYRNRMGGVHGRASGQATATRERKFGSRAGKGSSLTWGDLASPPKGGRGANCGARSQQKP